MKSKKIIALLLTLVLVLSLAACGGGGTEGDNGDGQPVGDTYTLRLGTQWAEGNPHSQAYINTFKPRLEELSEGRIQVEIYLNNVIGDEAEQCNQLQMGQLEMANLSDVSSGLDEGRISAYIIPFIFENADHFWEVANGEIGEYMVERTPEQGVRVLGMIDFGARNTTSNFRIDSAEDVEGKKMRISTSKYQLIPWQAMGANAISLPFPEVYSALETGTVDGQENPLPLIVSQRFYEAQDYLAFTEHVRTPLFICVSEQWYQSLPNDLKEILHQVVDETEADDKIRQAEAEAEALKIMEDAGLTITYPDRESFRVYAAAAEEALIADYPESEELINRIKEVGKKYK